MFVGKPREKAAALMLSDAQGRPRIRLMVDTLKARRYLNSSMKRGRSRTGFRQQQKRLKESRQSPETGLRR